MKLLKDERNRKSEIIIFTIQDISIYNASFDISRISVEKLRKGEDLAKKAADIMNSCKLIHPSKIEFVQSLLQYMIDRKDKDSLIKASKYSAHLGYIALHSRF